MVWLIILAPLSSTLTTELLLQNTTKKIKHTIATIFTLISFIGSIILFFNLLTVPSKKNIYFAYHWFKVGELTATLELIVDTFSALTLLFVSTVNTIIHVYANAYRQNNKTSDRFFSYLNLFVFMILSLLCANRLLAIFIICQGLVLCCYLLASHDYKGDTHARTDTKAGVVHKIGKLHIIALKISRFFRHNYWVDKLYNNYLAAPLYRLSHFLWKIIDVQLLNGLINGLSQLIMITTSISSFKNSGNLQRYAMMIVFGTLGFLLLLLDKS